MALEAIVIVHFRPLPLAGREGLTLAVAATGQGGTCAPGGLAAVWKLQDETARVLLLSRIHAFLGLLLVTSSSPQFPAFSLLSIKEILGFGRLQHPNNLFEGSGANDDVSSQCSSNVSGPSELPAQASSMCLGGAWDRSQGRNSCPRVWVFNF